MNSSASKAINGALSTAKQNAGNMKSLKIKIKFDSPGLKDFASKKKFGAKAMAASVKSK